MSYGPDLTRFEVFTVPRKKFFEDYRKTNISYEDYHAVFGCPGFHYPLCRSGSEIKKYGKSRVYVRLFTKKSLENLRADLIEHVKTKMMIHDIDTEIVKEQDLVIVAVDNVDASMINDSSFTMFFAPMERTNRNKGELRND